MSEKIEIRVVYSKKDKEYYEYINFEEISEFVEDFIDKVYIFQDFSGNIPKENVEKMKKMLEEIKNTIKKKEI